MKDQKSTDKNLTKPQKSSQTQNPRSQLREMLRGLEKVKLPMQGEANPQK